MRRSGFCPGIDAAILLLLLSGAAHAQCPTLGAEYFPASDPDGIKARLVLEAAAPPHAFSDLQIVLLVAGQAPEVFRAQHSQGYGVTTVISDGPALTGLDFPAEFLADGPGNRLLPFPQIIPSSTTPAPAAIFVTGLAPALWYASSGAAEPISLKNELWYLEPCRPM